MTRPLASLANFENGYPFKPNELGDEGTPVVRIRQLVDPQADLDRHSGVLPPRYVIDTGDLIFSWSGSLAVRFWERGRAYLNQHLFRVDPAAGVDRRWLGQILTASVPRLEGMMHGSAMTHITRPMLKLVNWDVPSLDEQRRIAEFLDDRVSRIDRIIAARREQVAEVRAYSRARIVASVFHPDDVMVPARALTEIRLGRQRSPTHESGDHMLPYLRSANIADGEVLLADVKSMNFNPEEQRTFALKSGDVLMTEGSASPDAVGASAVWQVNLPGVVCFQNTLLRLRAREMTSQEFIQWWARASHAAGAPRSWASGASILHLGADGLSRMPMPRVSIDEQNERASMAASAAEEGLRLAKALERSIELFAEYKSSLISAAAEGELDVSTAGSSIPG